MKIALSTDHAGFHKLQGLRTFVEALGHECINFGPTQLIADDDYPDYIRPAAAAVARGECDRGIILGGSGQGEAMVANRVKGVRCTVYYGPRAAVEAVNIEGAVNNDPLEIVHLSIEHNNANMLSLAARFLTENDIRIAIELWLNLSFSGEERHKRRIMKMDEVGQ